MLEREEDIAGFLELNITRDRDEGTLTLLQTGLIDKILVATQMEDCNIKSAPTDKIPLNKDLDGNLWCEEWDYISVDGMVLYLAGSTHSEISYAVHQCARFYHSPRALHKEGVNHIVRYLKGPRDKGLVTKPVVNNFKLDLFIDAGYVRLSALENRLDLVSIKSRTGVPINFGGVPVCWISKLQSEIVL